MAQTASESIARAREDTTCDPGQCLAYVVKWLNAPKIGAPDANTGYELTKDAGHMETGAPSTAPPGAMVWILGSEYGHVALSLGGGRIRSTDWASRGVVGEVAITDLCASWGRTYKGWSVYYGDALVVSDAQSGTDDDMANSDEILSTLNRHVEVEDGRYETYTGRYSHLADDLAQHIAYEGDRYGVYTNRYYDVVDRLTRLEADVAALSGKGAHTRATPPPPIDDPEATP